MDRSSHSSKNSLSAVRRFLSDRGGNFAIVTAVVFVPLLMSIAAVADISFFYRDRTAVQNAADAAALAAAKQFALTPDAQEVQRYAQSVFSANTQGLTRTTSVLKYEGTEWTPGGTRELRISACSNYDPFFLSALKISFSGLKGSSCAETKSVVAVGSTTVEVAFVLDTSGSMGDSPAAGGASKISTLRTQATKAINTIFGSATVAGAEDPVRVGIVPFSGGVNVGPEHLNDWWMDPKGLSPIHHENLDWSDYSGVDGKDKAHEEGISGGKVYVSHKLKPKTYLTRQLIYASLGSKNANWAYRGCVESRPAEHALKDTPPTELDPKTLYVPFFAPDEPDDSIYGFRNSYVRDGVTGVWDSRSFEDKTRGVEKYFLNVQPHGRLGANYLNSPSFMCDSPQLTPLTKDKSKALGAVKDLVASGATNVPQGVEWGWKILSKNEPFTEGRAAGEENNIKAMIVMTDGQNTYYNSYSPAVSAFGAYGYTGYDEPGRPGQPGPGVPRLFDYKSGVSTATTDANYTAALNGRLAAICENAKNDGRVKLKDGSGAQLKDERGPLSRDGILIYTIAFDIPPQYRAMVNGLLQGCASYKLNDLNNTDLPYRDKGKYFYSASNAKELETAFNDITASLTNLRIAR